MSDIFEPEELEAEQTGADGTISEQPEQTEQQTDDRPRDEHGRFAPKQAEEQPTAEEGEAERSRQVPQGALHAERERRKEAEGKWRSAQAQLDALQQMRQQITARQPEPQPQIEIRQDDPASETAYLRHRLEMIEGTQAGMVQRQQLDQVETAEQQHLAAVLSDSEAQFRAAQPDYDAAIDHVVNARAKELALYGLSPVEIQHTLRQEVLDITKSAIQQGRAPAEVGYELARLRGYQRAGQAQQQDQQPGAAQRQVQAVGAARAASKSLGQASGSATTRDLDANTIASMSIDEFDALYSTPEGRRLIDAL